MYRGSEDGHDPRVETQRWTWWSPKKGISWVRFSTRRQIYVDAEVYVYCISQPRFSPFTHFFTIRPFWEVSFWFPEYHVDRNHERQPRVFAWCHWPAFDKRMKRGSYRLKRLDILLYFLNVEGWGWTGRCARMKILHPGRALPPHLVYAKNLPRASQRSNHCPGHVVSRGSAGDHEGYQPYGPHAKSADSWCWMFSADAKILLWRSSHP